MAKRQKALVWPVCLVALAMGCKGCSGREEPAASQSDGSLSDLMDEGAVEGGASGGVPSIGVRAIGQPDEADRYLSTVGFHPVSAPKGTYRPSCNGVLIASNMVLTAAHCVCAPSRGETIRFDGSQCATKATVRADWWDHSFDGGRMPGWEDDIDGDILIHPQFQIVMDSQGAVLTSRADLALIRLARPVLSKIELVRLANEEVRAEEVVTVVGLGYANTGHVGVRYRAFSREKIQAPSGEDRFLFGSMEQADYKGDTGGPCLRETKRGLELVGISQRGLGRPSAFTHIAPYRKWLEEQIRIASGTP